jgi:pimeloyl-ACP methyl ester carboxylesterase
MRPFSLDRFQIDVPQTVIDDLHDRLDRTRWPEAETVDDWSQGVPLNYVREVADHWRHRYDWRQREARLNAVEHYITDIDGISIHFVHQRSPHPDAMPLLITHGWPGSVVEFYELLPRLTDPTAFGGVASDAFNVVCPSLPGYGFSSKPTATGTGVERIAAMWAELMQRLGYDRWVAQGGDWGAAVTTRIGRDASADPAHGCVGIHLNMPIAGPTPEALSAPTDADQAAFAALGHYQQWDSGYSKQQSTRPQTLGYGLTDSPVGQLAWILEKFWAWTDNDGHPESALDRDAMLDDVMMYWITASATSSARLYWESFGSFGPGDRVSIPTGVAAFPKEIIRSPRSWCEQAFNLVHWTDMPRGGHFAAFEQPELLAADIADCFRSLRQ